MLRSPIGLLEEESRLKTSKLSSESETSTIYSSSSSLIIGWEEVASSVVYCGGRVTLSTPFGIGLVVRKLGVATLI